MAGIAIFRLTLLLAAGCCAASSESAVGNKSPTFGCIRPGHAMRDHKLTEQSNASSRASNLSNFTSTDSLRSPQLAAGPPTSLSRRRRLACPSILPVLQPQASVSWHFTPSATRS